MRHVGLICSLKADCVWGEKNGILAHVCLSDDITKRHLEKIGINVVPLEQQHFQTPHETQPHLHSR